MPSTATRRTLTIAIRILAELLIVIASLSLVILIITGGMTTMLGPLKIKITRVKNPLIWFTLGLVLKRAVSGSFFQGLYSVAMLRASMCRLRQWAETAMSRWLRFPFVRRYGRLIILGGVSLSLALFGATRLFGLRHGLTAACYENADWEGPPKAILEPAPLALHVLRERVLHREEYYSIEWNGVLAVDAPGGYQFQLGSDDGSLLLIDGEVVVDNGGAHSYFEKSGERLLQPGFVPITIRYMQTIGVARLRLLWVKPGATAPEPVPPEAFFPRPPSSHAFIADRTFAQVWTAWKTVGGGMLLLFLLLLLLARRVTLPLLTHSSAGQAARRGIDWVFARDAGQPAFRWWPEQARPFPKLLFAGLALAFVVQVIGISWGLPDRRGWAPDEITPGQVLDGLGNAFSNDWHDKYPPLHYYVLTLTYLPVFLLERLNILTAQSFTSYTVMFYTGRMLSVLMGSATVFVLYLCGCELFKRRSTAVFAAIIPALTPPFVYYAKVVNLDVPYVFWFAVSLWFYIRILKHHRTTDYAFFAGAGMLAICTKDQAYGLYLLTPLALMASYSAYRRKIGSPITRIGACCNRKMLTGLSVAVVLFMGIHNLAFNWNGFVKHVQLIIGPGSEGYRIYDNTLVGHLSMFAQSIRHMNFALGWPVGLICLVGMGVSLVRYKKYGRLLWLWVPAVSYYLTFISVVGYNYVRFFMPMCIIAAFSGALVLEWLLMRSGWGKVIGYAVVLVIFGSLLAYGAAVDSLMCADARYDAERWMRQNIPTDASLGFVGLIEYLPRKQDFNNIQYFFDARPGEIARQLPDYLVINARQCKCPTLEDRLQSGALDYELVFQHRNAPALGDWITRPLYGPDGAIRIFTNLNKLNPEIRIFEKN